MIPFMKLNTSAVTTSHPPQSSRAARVRSVRGARRVNQSPATRPSNAAGSSQEISVPIDSPNILVIPVDPPNIGEPPIGPNPCSDPAPEPPGLPSPPNTRPRPL